MDADENSNPVGLIAKFVYKKTQKALTEMAQELLQQIICEGKSLKQLRYQNSSPAYIQRIAIHKQLFEPLTQAAGKKVGMKNIKWVVEEILREELQSGDIPQTPSPAKVETELHTENNTEEDCSPNTIAEQVQSSSQIFQLYHPEPESRSNTDGLPNFMKFMKPGVPLLISAGVLSCSFVLSWLANWYGVTNHIAGQLPKAQLGYSLALKFNPGSTAGHYNKAAISEDQHDYEKAQAEYQLAIAGGSIAAYNNQARLHILNGKYDTAVDLLRSSLPLVKDDEAKYTMLKNRGWARLGQGRYAEAKIDLEKAIHLKKKQSPAYCLLAQVLEREEDKRGALVYWESCLGYAYQPKFLEEDQWIHMAQQRVDAEGSKK